MDSAAGLEVLEKIVAAKVLGGSEVPERVLAMLQATAEVRYRGISLGWALRAEFYLHERDRLFRRGAPLRAAGWCFRQLAVLLRNLARGRCWKRAVDERLNWVAGQPPGQVMVACDYSGHTEKMAQGLLEQFPPQAVLPVTSNREVHARMRRLFPSCLEVYSVLRSFDWRLFPAAVGAAWRLWKSLPRKNLSLALFLLDRVPSAIQAIEFYERLFRSTKPRALMTMCDTHCHEYLMTTVARRHGIPTCTNLHGDPTVLIGLIPIASDRVFVWGERSRDHLIRNGVPPEKVLISGNPKFDRAFSHYLPRRDDLREELERRHGLRAGRPVVTFLSSGLLSTAELTEPVTFEIFRAFRRALEAPPGVPPGISAEIRGNFGVNVLIKLHPTSDRTALYRGWLDQLGAGTNFVLLQQEDLFEVLAVTDVAVTFHSTTGLEAIGFGIPTVVMNFVQGIDVRQYITYAGDALHCRTEEEFRQVLWEMLSRPERYREEAERTRAARSKYFRNSEGFSTSAFLRDQLLGESTGAGGGFPARSSSRVPAPPPVFQ